MSYPGVGITRIQFDGSNLSPRPTLQVSQPYASATERGSKHPLVGDKDTTFFVTSAHHEEKKATDYFSVAFLLFSRRYAFMRRQPSTPTIAKPVYCAVLAQPNNTIHSTLLAWVEMGNAICANEAT